MAFMNLTTTTEFANLIPEIWARKLFMKAQALQWWQRFVGNEGSGMPIIRKTELLTEPGDTIRVNRLVDLTGTGVTGESTLVGNEEQITTQQVSVVPEWIRHGVASTGKAKKQINNDFRQMAMTLLARWIAEKQDKDKWTAAQQTAAVGWESEAIGIVYGGDATSVDTIDSSDEFTAETVRKTVALMRGDNIHGISIPGLPGEEYFVCMIHPYQAYSLKQDTEWITNHRDCSERGKMNPIFTGALGELDGAVIYESTNCGRTQNANSPAVYYSRAVMIGAEAIAHGENKVLTWNEQTRDYGFEHGVGIEIAYQDKVLCAKAIKQIVTSSEAPNA